MTFMNATYKAYKFKTIAFAVHINQKSKSS